MGVETDAANANSQHTRAADVCDSCSGRCLSDLCFHCAWLEKNAAKELELYSRAAKAGGSYATRCLRDFYSDGDEVEVDVFKEGSAVHGRHRRW
jgi:hypothetical protein